MNKNKTSRGYLIVFEGLDRSGKSTQCQKLLNYFNLNKNQKTYIQAFPDRKTPTGMIINDYLTKKSIIGYENTKWDVSSTDITIHLLFSANRWEKRSLILNHLYNGNHVIVDRYAFSGVAFTHAKGYDFEWCKSSDQGLPKPDIIFYFYGNIENLNQRNDFGKEIYETNTFQQKVFECYKKFQNMDLNWIMINANRDIETIHKEIVYHIENLPTIFENGIETLWNNYPMH